MALSTSCIDTRRSSRQKKEAGGNYVDVSLKTIVKMDTGTVLVCALQHFFIINYSIYIKITRPDHKHGTTLPRSGLQRTGIAHTWSTHIKEAYEKACYAHNSNQIADIAVVDEI
jgi:hypothetical protein